MSTEFTVDTDFTSLTMPNLKKFLKERNLPQSGNKTSVIIRIKEVLAEEAKAKANGVEPTVVTASASSTSITSEASGASSSTSPKKAAKIAGSPVKPTTKLAAAATGVTAVVATDATTVVKATEAVVKATDAVVNGDATDSKEAEGDKATPAAEAVDPSATKVHLQKLTGDIAVSKNCSAALQSRVETVNAKPVRKLVDDDAVESGQPAEKKQALCEGLTITDTTPEELEKLVAEDKKKLDAKLAEKKSKTSGEITDDSVKKNKRNITPIVFDGVSTVIKKKVATSGTDVADKVPSGQNKDGTAWDNEAVDPSVTTQAAENEANVEAKVNQDTPMKELTQEEKMARRAAKYGIVNTPETKKSARAKRFGASGDSPAVSMDIDVIKKRAERFGTVTSSSLKKEKEQQALEKRKERFNAMDPEMKAKMEKRAKRFSTDVAEPAKIVEPEVKVVVQAEEVAAKVASVEELAVPVAEVAKSEAAIAEVVA